MQNSKDNIQAILFVCIVMFSLGSSGCDEPSLADQARAQFLRDSLGKIIPNRDTIPEINLSGTSTPEIFKATCYALDGRYYPIDITFKRIDSLLQIVTKDVAQTYTIQGESEGVTSAFSYNSTWNSPAYYQQIRYTVSSDVFQINGRKFYKSMPLSLPERQKTLRTHTIQKGETENSLKAKYGVTVKNPKVGQTINYYE